MSKKRYKRYAKSAIGLGVASVGLGVGSSVIEGAGGSAAPLATMGKYMPTMGKVMGGSILINELGNLSKTTTKLMKKKKLRY